MNLGIPPSLVKLEFHKEGGFALSGTVAGGKQVSDDLSFLNFGFLDIRKLHTRLNLSPASTSLAYFWLPPFK